MSHEHIDGLILSFARADWRKVAMVIARVSCECEREGRDIDNDKIADRIVALVDAGKLEAQGEVSSWRHGEVKLPNGRLSLRKSEG